MRKIACVSVIALLLAACGSGNESSKVGGRLSVITNGSYQSVHDGNTDVTGSTILAAIQGKEPPINFEAVLSVPQADGRAGETRLTFAITPQQKGTWELYYGTGPVSVPGETDYQTFLKAASEKIADIYNAEREKLAKAKS
jgi:hypothetical protein